MGVISKCNELLEEVSRRICALQEVVMDEYGELLRTCVSSYASEYGSYGSRSIKGDSLNSEEEYTFVSAPPDDVMRELLLKRAVRRQVEASIFLGVRRQLLQDGSDILFPCLQQMQGFMLLLASEQMALQARKGINVHFKDPSRFTPGEEHFDPGVMVRAGDNVKPLFGIDPRVRGCRAFKEAIQSWKDLQIIVLPSDLARGLIGCARHVVSLYQAYLKIISPDEKASPMTSPFSSPFASPLQSPSSQAPTTPDENRVNTRGPSSRLAARSKSAAIKFETSPATSENLFSEKDSPALTLSFEENDDMMTPEMKSPSATVAEQLVEEGPFRNVQLSASRARILQRHIEYHRSGKSLAGVLEMATAENVALEAPSLGLGMAAMSADEFLPLFAYVLVHARPRRLLLLQLLVPALLDPDDAVGERGYHCATLQAGVQLVLQLWDERLEQENARERRELRRRRSSFDFEMSGP